MPETGMKRWKPSGHADSCRNASFEANRLSGFEKLAGFSCWKSPHQAQNRWLLRPVVKAISQKAALHRKTPLFPYRCWIRIRSSHVAFLLLFNLLAKRSRGTKPPLRVWQTPHVQDTSEWPTTRPESSDPLRTGRPANSRLLRVGVSCCIAIETLWCERGGFDCPA